MSNQLFQQNLDDKKGPQPGGPYLIQMLFKEPVDMPDKETMTAVIEKHIGSTECFCYDKQMAGFAAQEHIAEFKDGKCPVQLMVMKCDRFKGKSITSLMPSKRRSWRSDRSSSSITNIRPRKNEFSNMAVISINWTLTLWNGRMTTIT